MLIILDKTRSRDFNVRFINEPPIAAGAPAGSCGVDEQRSEPLHPPVDGHVINFDARSANSSSTQRNGAELNIVWRPPHPVGSSSWWENGLHSRRRTKPVPLERR